MSTAKVGSQGRLNRRGVPMYEFLSLEDEFLRNSFLLNPAQFKLLVFCHFANQKRQAVVIESSFDDVQASLNLSIDDIKLGLLALNDSHLIELYEILDQSFRFKVKENSLLTRELPTEKVQISQQPAPEAAPAAKTSPRAMPSLQLEHLSFDLAEITKNPKEHNAIALSLCSRVIDRIENAVCKEKEKTVLKALLSYMKAEDLVIHLRSIPMSESEKFAAVMSRLTEQNLRQVL